MPDLTLRTAFPDLTRFVESGWPFVPFGDRHPVRIEEHQDADRYLLRAELPGMDPQKDIQVSVQDNELSITAERTVERHDKAHSEFSYGSFVRTVRLPGGAAVDKMSAHYDAGILEVTVPLAAQATSRQIPVEAGKTTA
jgi:HSP20 family protein